MRGLLLISQVVLSVALVVVVIAALNGKRIGWTSYTPSSTEERTYSLWPLVVLVGLLFAAATLLTVFSMRPAKP